MEKYEKSSSIESAGRKVRERFPFPEFIGGALKTTTTIVETAQKYLVPGSRVLDFGCGPCDKTAVVQEVGYKCTGFDDLLDDWHLLNGNKKKILRFASEFGIDFRLASDGYLPFQKESFDMVMAHDVLEHLHDSPRELLNDLVELIRPNGFLFITVPNAGNIRKRLSLLVGKTNLPRFGTYYWYPGPWRGHIREYVRDDLGVMCKYLGLHCEELRSCHHMLHLVPKRILPVYLIATKFFTGWRDSWLLVARKPIGWEAKREISRRELASILGPVSPYYLNQQ